jgi:hypothetical protein
MQKTRRNPGGLMQICFFSLFFNTLKNVLGSLQTLTCWCGVSNASNGALYTVFLLFLITPILTMFKPRMVIICIRVVL